MFDYFSSTYTINATDFFFRNYIRNEMTYNVKMNYTSTLANHKLQCANIPLLLHSMISNTCWWLWKCLLGHVSSWTLQKSKIMPFTSREYQYMNRITEGWTCLDFSVFLSYDQFTFTEVSRIYWFKLLFSCHIIVIKLKKKLVNERYFMWKISA